MSASSPPPFPVPRDEEARLKALARFRVAGTLPEKQFDEIARLMAGMFAAPIAIISIIDRDKQWIKAGVGLTASDVPRSVSFCTHTIMNDGVFVVPDALKDERFSDNPLVKGKPDIRFYAGAPLITKDGFRLGALCVLDTKARRPLDRKQETLIKNFAELVMTHLSLRHETPAQT